MNYVDLILLAVAALAIYHGWRKGFIDLSVEIIVWAGSFLITLLLSEYTISFLARFHVEAIWVRPVFFMVLLVGFSRLIFVFCDDLSRKVPAEVHYHWSNRAAGCFPGIITGTLYASLIAFFLLSYNLGELTERTKASRIASLLTNENEMPGKMISAVLKKVGYRLSNSMTVYPDGRRIVSLPFKSDRFTVRHDLELEMVDYINAERAKAGLRPMVYDAELARVARKHSADMIRRGYFAHYNIEGFGPFERMKRMNIRYTTAGENLALARSLQLAHDGLMGSPVHKANILHSSFGRAGIGIVDAGIHGLMVTQNFRN